MDVENKVFPQKALTKIMQNRERSPTPLRGQRREPGDEFSSAKTVYAKMRALIQSAKK